ncbi:GPW/gp25 family protein [Crocinitomicaceae bacterium]|nr:GPW/gp25 family protein [Crocinitomicaceae bacterium]
MSNQDTRTTNIRPHLGCGWSFPVRPENGRLRYAKYEEDVEQAIGIILETAANERMMRPHFGGGLHTFLFESNSSVTHQRIREQVKAALLDWEPRIDVTNVSVTASANEPNLMFIAIDYVVRRSNSFYNRVYPFYLNEAG